LTPKDYRYYTARDFALDEEFQQWILHPGIKSNAFWESWITQHPEKKETIETAMTLIRTVRFRSYSLAEKDKGELWDAIWDKIGSDEMELETEWPGIKSKKKWTTLSKYAAAVLLILVTTLALWKMTVHKTAIPRSFTVQTRAGEIKKVMLPDSSEVLMNANSRLVYHQKDAHAREVWLEGEAYFDVKHTVDQKAFLVHTYDNISIDVLGTRFNVNSFGKRISVVLQQGKIKLSIAENQGETQLYLKPGEVVNYNKESGNYAKSNTDTSQALSWTHGRLIMDHYSLNDVASFMKNIFDKNVIIQHKKLLQDSVSGSMPIVYNADTMLMQFSKVFEVQFKQHNKDEIWVQKQ